LGVDVGQTLRPVDCLGRLDRLEIGVPSCTDQGGRGLILSYDAGCMVMNASWLCEFWSPPRLRVGGRAFSWGVGRDEVRDFGEGVVEP